MRLTEKEHELAIEELRKFCRAHGLPDPTRPVVIFNADYNSKGAKLVVPNQIVALINEPEEIVQRRILKPNELNEVRLSVEQAAQFEKGEPVLIDPYILDRREKQASGGQPLDELEEKVKDAAGDYIYVAVEQLVELLEIRDKRIFTKDKDGARDNAMQSLTNAYLKSHNPIIDDKKCRTMINSLFKHGQRRGNIVPGIAMQSSNQIIESWYANLPNFPKANLLEEINYVENIVISLMKCRVRSHILRMEENKLLNLTPKHPEDGIGTEWIIAGTQRTIHQKFEHLMPAAFAGDFNPSDLFPNLKQSRSHFEAIRLIGRIARGHQNVKLPPELHNILESATSILRSWESYPTKDKRRVTSKNAFLAIAMSKIMPSFDWQKKYLNED